MLTLHDDIELICGDTWVIDGTLLDEDNNPINLDSSIPIAWTLLDPDGIAISSLSDFIDLERVDPVTSGQVVITVAAALTSQLRPGRYTDALRVQVEGSPATLWRGLILAGADPFYTEPPMVQPLGEG